MKLRVDNFLMRIGCFSFCIKILKIAELIDLPSFIGESK